MFEFLVRDFLKTSHMDHIASLILSSLPYYNKNKKQHKKKMHRKVEMALQGQKYIPKSSRDNRQGASLYLFSSKQKYKNLTVLTSPLAVFLEFSATCTFHSSEKAGLQLNYNVWALAWPHELATPLCTVSICATPTALYLRPSVYWLQSLVYPWLLNGTDVYLEGLLFKQIQYVNVTVWPILAHT